MLRNKMIRYKAQESLVYMFVPTLPLKFLGLPVKHISGFDVDTPFKGVPGSRQVGTAPPVFLEIDVAAPESELRKRAIGAGFVRGRSLDRPWGEVWQSGLATYLADEKPGATSSITCSI
jgi:hypothetical protein